MSTGIINYATAHPTITDYPAILLFTTSLPASATKIHAVLQVL